MKRITLSEPSQRWVKGNEATFDPSIIYFERSSGWKSVLPRPFQNGGEEGMGAKTTLFKFIQKPFEFEQVNGARACTPERVQLTCRHHPFHIEGVAARAQTPPSEEHQQYFREFWTWRGWNIFPEHLLFYLEDARWILDNRERSFPSNQIKVLILLSDVLRFEFQSKILSR